MASHTRIKKLVLVEYGFLISVGIYALWSLWRIATTTIPDFSVLFQSAQNLRTGASLYHDATLFTGLGYPAISLLPYVPFTLLPYPVASWVWVLLSFISYLAVVYLSLHLIGKQSIRVWVIFCAVGFLAFPTKFTFGMGQVNFIALSLLLFGLSSLRIPKALRVVVLTIALLFKPHFIFVYIGLLFTTYKKYIVFCFASVLLLAISLGFVTGWVHDREYLFEMVPNLLVYKGREIYYNQGVVGFVSRLFGANSQHLSYIGIVLITFSSIYKVAKKRSSVVALLAVLLPMQVLIEPLAWQHHLVFLLPTFLILWFTPSLRDRSLKFVLMLCLLLVGWNIKNPLYWQGNMIGSLVLSHGFIGCLVLWYLAIGYI